MPFTAILKEFSMKAGAAGAVMMDKDGEIVAAWSEPGVAIDLIGVHHEIILDIIRDAAGRHGSHEVETVAITTDKARLVISAVKEGYCIVAALRRACPVGKALLESEKMVELIETEMG